MEIQYRKSRNPDIEKTRGGADRYWYSLISFKFCNEFKGEATNARDVLRFFARGSIDVNISKQEVAAQQEDVSA